MKSSIPLISRSAAKEPKPQTQNLEKAIDIDATLGGNAGVEIKCMALAKPLKPGRFPDVPVLLRSP
jgi:hypothetical protein